MTSPQRPLSPHIQVYKPQITSVMSILHRTTGIALTVGSLLLVYWLTSLAAGADAYTGALGFLSSWFGRLLMFGFTIAMFYHLANGVRHLFWDSGRGFEMSTVYASGWAVIIFTVVMTLATWSAAYMWR